MAKLSEFAQRLWPRDALRERFINRVRLRRDIAPPFTLEYRGIFILPTLFGTGFGLMLLLTGLGGLNFNNNLALLLVFITGAMAQTTTLLAHRNLVGLKVRSALAEPVFAGEQAHLELVLLNPGERHRFSVQAALAHDSHGDCIDIKSGATGRLVLDLPAPQRGWLKPPPLRIDTRYPLGLFRVWSWVTPGTRSLVYPRPSANPPPLPASGAGTAGLSHRGEGDQVYGLRPYRAGDSLKRIAWRTSARHDQLFTREMETPREASCVLDWYALDGLGTEERLSILTAWVLLAEHHGVAYALALPGTTLPSARGEPHRSECLATLALFGL